MFSGVGGSMLIFAGAWPRMLPSDFRVRSLDGIADDWPLTYDELRPTTSARTASSASPGMGGDPAYPPGGEDPPLPPLPVGKGGLKVARAHTRLGWHWWPEFNSILSAPYDGRRACVQRGTCQQGCNEGAKASTDLTHWPKAIGLGAQLITGARVRRVETNDRGPRDRRDLARPRRRASTSQPAKVVVLAANAIGTPRLLLLSGEPAPSRRPRELVRARREAADDASVRERRRAVRRGPRELAGPVRLLDRVVRVLRDRREARLRARRQVGPRAHRSARSTPRSPAGPATQVWGPDHHVHVKAHLGRGANWGLFGEDLPDEANRVTLSLDADRLLGHPGARDPLPDVRQLAPAARLPHREGDGVAAWRPAPTRSRSTGSCATPAGTCSGTARMGDDPETSVLDRWNRTHDVPNLYVVDGSCFVTSAGVNPTSLDRRARAPGRRPHGRDAVRAAGAGMSATERRRR